MNTTPSTVGTDSTAHGDLPVGKLAHSNTPRTTAWSGRSAERGNPDGHRGFLRGPLLSAAGPIFHLVATASGREVPSVASHRRGRRLLQGDGGPTST